MDEHENSMNFTSLRNFHELSIKQISVVVLQGRASPHSMTEKGQSPLLMAAEQATHGRLDFHPTFFGCAVPVATSGCQGHHDAVAVLLTADEVVDQRVAALHVAVDKGGLSCEEVA